MRTPLEDEKPEGFEPVADDEIVKDGDMVLDYLHAKGFAVITSGGTYDQLIGKTGYFARLDKLAYEVFTAVPNEQN